MGRAPPLEERGISGCAGLELRVLAEQPPSERSDGEPKAYGKGERGEGDLRVRMLIAPLFCAVVCNVAL
jgi:hypothetical protein